VRGGKKAAALSIFLKRREQIPLEEVRVLGRDFIGSCERNWDFREGEKDHNLEETDGLSGGGCANRKNTKGKPSCRSSVSRGERPARSKGLL